MTVKAYRRMVRKMRKYISSGKTFDRFRNDHLGYNVGWSTMLRGWRVAEFQVLGRAKEHDAIITYK